MIKHSNDAHKKNTRTLRIELFITTLVVAALFIVAIWVIGNFFDFDKIVTPAYTSVFLIIAAIIFIIDTFTITAAVSPSTTTSQVRGKALFTTWLNNARVALPFVGAAASIAGAWYTLA